MVDILASFTGPDRAALYPTDDGRAFTVARGTFSNKSNRGLAQATGRVVSGAATGAIAWLEGGPGGNDASFEMRFPAESNSGGQALIFRYVDLNNWWRYSAVRESSTYTYQSGTETYQSGTKQVIVGYTPIEYEWKGEYAVDVTHGNSDLYALHYNLIRWSSSNSQSPFGTLSHFHYLSGTYYPGDERAHSHNVRVHFYTGNQRGGQPIYRTEPVYSTRPVYTTTTGYNSSVFLEKCVAGTVTLVKKTSMSGQPTMLRVVARGNTIQGFSNEKTAEAYWTVTDAAHASATKFGFGYSERTQYSNSQGIDDLRVTPFNVAPNAPLDKGPINNAILPRTSPAAFPWVFSDPDPADRQSLANFDYKLVSADDWTTIQARADQQVTIPENTLTAGDYVRQISTADSQGVFGPPSPLAYFTMADPPPGPSILSPAGGGVVNVRDAPVRWSSSTPQQAYLVRVLADVAGQPGAEIYNSGVVESETAFEHMLAFPDDGVSVHVQVQVRSNGLWSAFASVRVTVSYEPPAAPLGAVFDEPGKARLLVLVSHPAPSGAQPEVLYHRIDRRLRHRVNGFGPWETVAPRVERSESYWLDETPTPGEFYEYRAIAVGSNTTQSESEPFVGILNLEGYWLKDPADWTRSTKVRVTDFPELTRKRESTVYDVLGREDAVVEFGPRRLARGSFTLMTHDRAEREAVDSLLHEGRTLLLLCPAEAPGEGGEALWFVSLEAAHQRPARIKTSARYMPVSFIEQRPVR